MASGMDWVSRRDALELGERRAAAAAYLRERARQAGYDGGADHLLAIAEMLEEQPAREIEVTTIGDTQRRFINGGRVMKSQVELRPGGWFVTGDHEALPRGWSGPWRSREAAEAAQAEDYDRANALEQQALRGGQNAAKSGGAQSANK